jgi:hypothetical protein
LCRPVAARCVDFLAEAVKNGTVSRTQELMTVVRSLPHGARIAPLREVRERESEEALGTGEFPVAALATELLEGREAWQLWRELHASPGLSGVSTFVAGGLELPWEWEEECKRAREMIARLDAGEPWRTPAGGDVRAWLDRDEVRYVLRALGVDAPGPEIDEDDLEEGLSYLVDARDPPPPRKGPPGQQYYLAPPRVQFGDAVSLQWYEADADADYSAIYVLDVPPWAPPVVLQWLFTEERWRGLVPLFRSWNARFGFEVVSFDGGTLQAWIRRPPSTFDEVERRLTETLLLCPEVDDLEMRLLMVLGQAWHFRFV